MKRKRKIIIQQNRTMSTPPTFDRAQPCRYERRRPWCRLAVRRPTLCRFPWPIRRRGTREMYPATTLSPCVPGYWRGRLSLPDLEDEGSSSPTSTMETMVNWLWVRFLNASARLAAGEWHEIKGHGKLIRTSPLVYHFCSQLLTCSTISSTT